MAEPEPLRRHFLHPCTLVAERQELVVTTVLGSCVAVCLWDAQAGVGGMNHFMLPLWNNQGLPTPKFGNVAIQKLLDRLAVLGASPGRLVAKVYGGGNVLGPGASIYPVGDRNASVALELLARHRIPIVASALGGTQARRISFNTRSGLATVEPIRAGQLA